MKNAFGRPLGAAALLFLTACCLLARAAEPKKAAPLVVSGDTMIVVKSLPCKVTAPAGYDLYDWSFGDDVKADSDGNVLTVRDAPQGKFRVRVRMTSIDFDKKKVSRETGEVEVNYGGVVPPPPNPGPGPGPKPPPPPPDDALVKALKAAYQAEHSPDKGKHLAGLAALYDQASRMDLAGVKTTGELYGKLIAAGNSLLPRDAIPAVRAAVGEQLKAVLSDSTADLTDEMRQRSKSLFGRLSDALKEAGKP